LCSFLARSLAQKWECCGSSEMEQYFPMKSGEEENRRNPGWLTPWKLSLSGLKIVNAV
jgi:hypothetical protein